MSFRNRLTLFFIVIVIVPMIAVALVLFRLVSDSEAGKGDARLGQAQRAAQGTLDLAADRATEAGREIISDAEFAAAVASEDRARVQSELERLARENDVVRARADLDGLGRFEVGRGQVVAPTTSRLVSSSGDVVGRLRVSTLSAAEYARQLRATTELDVSVVAGGRAVATTLEGVDTSLPQRGETEVGDTTYRFTGFERPAFEGENVKVRLFVDAAKGGRAFSTESALVGVALVGFLVLAFAFALSLSRSLQAQVQRLLDAARRLGSGDFDVQVPTEGNDEFAELGEEFNAMARQLESRLEELQQERARLQDAIRRVGESFAKGLDRDALLGIIVQTAVDGVGADCGRATVRDRLDGPPVEVARAGDLVARKDAIHAVESEALRSGHTAETTIEGASALAQPLRSPEDGRLLGVISVARAAREFSEPEKELFNYLSNQAAVSLENVDLHETVQRQAVTDELTGLFNHRRFQEVMALEVERTRRFGSDMGLIMLDLDNFKKVNDTYGHMQGDLVLREVAQVLRDSAREIDEPARYGGEEMAVALPQTDLEGAFQFAERVRQRIEALDLPILDGGGTLKVTASFGAAALGGHGPVADTDKEALVAAADAALYRAKRSGKNRTVKAE